MSVYKMTKEQLVAECKRLQSENERLQSELNDLSDCYCEMENQLAGRINMLDEMDTIKDVREFKYRLMVDDLLTPQLESFIEYYLRFYNGTRG